MSDQDTTGRQAMDKIRVQAREDLGALLEAIELSHLMEREASFSRLVMTLLAVDERQRLLLCAAAVERLAGLRKASSA